MTHMLRSPLPAAMGPSVLCRPSFAFAYRRPANDTLPLGVGRAGPAHAVRHRRTLGHRPAQRITPQPLNPILQLAAAAATATTGAPAAASAVAAAAPGPDPWQAARLALRILAPDWLLGVATAAFLVLSIANTLAFPAAIGQLFDVVKQHGVTSLVPASASTAAPAMPSLLTLGVGSAIPAPSTFKAALAFLGVCLTVGPITAAAVTYLAPLLAERFATRMRMYLLEEVLQRDQSFFDHTSKGDLVSRISLDVATLQACLSDLIGQRGLRSLLEVLGPMVIIAVRHPMMAVITCAVTPLLSRAMRSVVVKSTDLSFRRQEVAAAAMEFASDRLTHVQTVQVFSQEDREAASFKRLADQGFEVAGKYAVYQGLVEGAGRLAVNVGTISLLGFGGWLAIQGQLSVGTLLSYMVYNLFISLGLSQLAASLGDVGKAIGALERISTLVGDPDGAAGSGGGSSGDGGISSSQADVAAYGSKAGSSGQVHAAVASHTGGGSTHSGNGSSHAPQVAGELGPATNGAADLGWGSASSSRGSLRSGGHGHPAPLLMPALPAQAAPGDVALRDVWFRYQGRDDWALQGLSLSVPDGSTMALVGLSGGGKSTVASLLLGLYKPQGGEVEIGGQPMRGPADWAGLRQRMAAVLQQPMLMSGSVEQQIAYGRPDATFEEVVAAAKQANADEFIRELPQGYGTQVGERGHALSGGQKQRIAIARALLCKPKILVLDEVTSALDVESEVAIDAALAQLRGCTKLVIAHRLSTVRSADCIAVVAGGRVVEAGPHEELVAAEGGLYQRLVATSEL